MSGGGLHKQRRSEKVVHMVLYLQISQHKIVLSCNEEDMKGGTSASSRQ